MRRSCSLMSLVALVFWASTSAAEPDTLGLGTGRDGALIVTEPRTVINRYAQVTVPLATGDTVLFVSSTEGFAAGDLIMVLQTTGIVPEPAQGAPGPISLSTDPVGRWELARVSFAERQELKLGAPLLYSYAGLVTQVIRIPEYTDVKVVAGASLVAAPWDGSQGGVLAFLAKGLIQNEGTLQASGVGFRGGLVLEEFAGFAGCAALPASVRPGAGRGEGISSLDFGVWATGLENASNGGGGGLCPRAGGGGGGNGAAGGRGGDSLVYGDSARNIGGKGGAGLVYSLTDHLTLGGGGGQGYGGGRHSQGGAGGGAIFVRGYRLAGSGSILADGAAGDDATQGGAGGGGAGGSVYLRFVDSAECGFISASGGNGGSSSAGIAEDGGAGGGGGGGRLLYQAASTGACPMSVEAGLAGGVAGTISGIVTNAQPAASQLVAHRGIITRLETEFEQFANCTLNAPVFTTPVNNGYVNAQLKVTGSVSGYGSNAKVRIYVGSDLAGDATPNSGTWSYTFAVGVLEDARQYTIKAIGVCGSNSEESSNATSINVTVDTAVPQIGWVTRPSDPSPELRPTLSFNTGNQEVSVRYTCTLDGSAGFGCGVGTTGQVVSYTVAGTLLDGSRHTFTVRGTDEADNPTNGSLSYSWTVIYPSDTVIDPPRPPDPTNVTAAAFSFHATKAGATLECRLDESAWAACTSPKSYSALADGRHTFEVKAMLGSIEDTSPASYSWVVDTESPDTRIEQKPNDPTNSTRATFTFSSPEEGCSFECSLNGGVYTSCPSPWTSPELADSRHTLSVRARDAAGNIDPSPATYSWLVDSTPPNTVFDQKPTNPSNVTRPTFAFSASETGSSFVCSLDSAAFTPCTSPVTTPLLAEGSHTFAVKATDALGNTAASATTYTWVVDITPPDTILGDKPTNPSNEPRPRFTFSATETGSTFECRMDQGLYVTCSSPWTAPSLTDGSHTFEVRATDAAGNVDPTPVSYTWDVDTEAPDTAIEQKPSNPSNSARATFTFSGQGGAVGFECSLDSAQFAPCTSPWQSPLLAEGNHTFAVRAKDAAGNIDPSPATYTWRVDTQPPDTSIDQKPPNPDNRTSATFTFASSEAGSSFECSLDDGEYASCTSPLTYSVPEGSHIFAVRAKDAAGNVDDSPATYTWRVDTGAPDTAIDQKPPNPSNNANPTFTFTSTEPGSSFECSLDSGPFAACASPVVFHVSEGSHSLSVRAKDGAGNVDPSPATYPWVVDLTPPDTAIEAPRPRNPTNETSATFRFSGAGAEGKYYCKLDEQVYADCSSGTITYDALSQRVHTFSVYAKDAAGNDDLQNPATYIWEVDTEPPETVIEEASKPPNPTSLLSATFRFSGAGPGGHYQCSLDSQSYVGCDSGTITFSPLSNGEHYFKVFAIDAAGNADASPAEYRWVVDSSPPETVILEVTEAGGIAARNPTNSRSMKFRFSGADAPGGYRCRLESPTSPGNFSPCGTRLGTGTGTAGIEEYVNLGAGRHVFSVYAVDAAGNEDPSAATYEWVVDLQPPVTTITNPATNAAKLWRTNQTSPVFRGTSEMGSRVVLQIDGLGTDTQQMGSSGNWELTTRHVLAEGKHVVRVVEATDAVGNTWTPSSTSPLPSDSAFEFWVDTTPPQTAITQKPPEIHNSISVLFNFSDPTEEDGLSTTFECKVVAQHLEKEFESPCLGEQPYNLANIFEIANDNIKAVNGTYTIFVAARDEAGNLDETPASYAFTVIVEPPDAPQIKKPANGDEIYDLNPSVSGNTIPNGSVEFFLDGKSMGSKKADAAGVFTFRFADPLEERAHELRASVTDLASNPSPQSQPITFTVFAPKPVAEAIGGGLGCAASTAEPWLVLLGLFAGGVLRSRHRRR
ncbi:hypothetical protein DB31_3323 [Hyalangium minutum]|uniref:Ig-like domain-containing protein n=2 Tax=Hyalangium minutum TaxID=394096 RepID=A0A085WU30_9BACT|nr:hypothetical protein DB31_3323 [Hyalangium minutum]